MPDFCSRVRGRAAGADEHELGVNGGFFTVAVQIGNGHAPGLVGVALDVAHFVAQVQLELVAGAQRVNQLVGDHAEVNVGTQRHAGRGDFLRRIAAVHHQWRPLFDLRRIFGVFHAAEQGAVLQRRVAFTQEVDVVVTPTRSSCVARC